VHPECATVVVVHWNQPESCARTIDAFLDQGLGVEILVIDNGSEPANVARLRDIVEAAGPAVQLAAFADNLGFGPGANAGLRWWRTHSTTEWAAVAPHDALPDRSTLRDLIAAAEARPHAGLACADVGDGETPAMDPYFGGMTLPAKVGAGWEAADYPHGTLMIARRACLEEIGMFDERYFAYCEEADLGIRAREAGWEVGLVRGVMVRNPTMQSGSPAVDYLMQRNTLLLVKEHAGRYHAFIRFCIALYQLGRGVVRPSKREWLFSASGRVVGLLDFLRGRYGPPPAFLFPRGSTARSSTHAPTSVPAGPSK
jgi:N-acetylglucosaminyl-diphospho-decaprenol L-rhamnosyltransferase